MLKFFLILILIFYLIYRVGGFFFRMLFASAFQQQRQYQAHERQQTNDQRAKTPPNGNVRVDYVPEEGRESNKDFRGGQYVDFEEVK